MDLTVVILNMMAMLIPIPQRRRNSTVIIGDCVGGIVIVGGSQCCLYSVEFFLPKHSLYIISYPLVCDLLLHAGTRIRITGSNW